MFLIPKRYYGETPARLRRDSGAARKKLWCRGANDAKGVGIWRSLALCALLRGCSYLLAVTSRCSERKHQGRNVPSTLPRRAFPTAQSVSKIWLPPSMSQSSQRKGWPLARSEAPAAAQRAMNALAASEDMTRSIKAELHCLQAIRSLRVLHAYREAQDPPPERCAAFASFGT